MLLMAPSVTSPALVDVDYFVESVGVGLGVVAVVSLTMGRLVAQEYVG